MSTLSGDSKIPPYGWLTGFPLQRLSRVPSDLGNPDAGSHTCGAEEGLLLGLETCKEPPLHAFGPPLCLKPPPPRKMLQIIHLIKDLYSGAPGWVSR